jgi:hypothetical protein
VVGNKRQHHQAPQQVELLVPLGLDCCDR